MRGFSKTTLAAIIGLTGAGAMAPAAAEQSQIIRMAGTEKSQIIRQVPAVEAETAWETPSANERIAELARRKARGEAFLTRMDSEISEVSAEIAKASPNDIPAAEARLEAAMAAELEASIRAERARVRRIGAAKDYVSAKIDCLNKAVGAGVDTAGCGRELNSFIVETENGRKVREAMEKAEMAGRGAGVLGRAGH